MATLNNRNALGFLAPILLGSLSALTACTGSAQLVLKGPVTDECASAGLNGCDDISEGALLYAEGEPGPGETKLARGLRANAGRGAELRKFADGLLLIEQIPSASRYVEPLLPAVQLVRQAAEEEEEEARRRRVAKNEKAKPAPVETAEATVPTPSGTDSKAPAANASSSGSATVPPVPAVPPSASYFMVAGNERTEPCRFAGTPKMLCLNELAETTKIVSDIIVSPGCSSDVVITSRIGLDPDWVVYVPAGRGTSVLGASLPIHTGRTLTVGVAQKTQDPAPDMRCGVTVVWQFWKDDARPSHSETRNDSGAKGSVETLGNLPAR